MSFYNEILDDLTGTADLSVILRKTKVLSYKLKNKEFKDWIDKEFNGYPKKELPPRYRIVNTIAQGDFLGEFGRISDYIIPIHIVPAKFQDAFTKVYLKQGIKEIESLCEIADNVKGKTLRMSIPPVLAHLLDYKVFEGMQCFEAWRLLGKSQIVQILDATRNKLLDFVLELGEEYPEIQSNISLIKPIPDDKILKIFNYSIYGGKQNIVGATESLAQGDDMTVFDQRYQNVDNQYNAARDINFGGVQDTSAFIEELQKLKAEFLKEAEREAIDGEVVTDAEYQLTKAIQQSQKSEPQKTSIIGHLETAKQLFDGVKVTTGLITALSKAIEVAQAIFI